MLRGVAGGSRPVRHVSEFGEWESVSRAPAPGLRPYVRRLSGWWERTAFTRRREVPGAVAVLIVNIGNRLLVNENGAGSPMASYHGFFAGLHSSHVITESNGGIGGGVQVDFTPMGAYLFTGIPAHELANRTLHAEDALGREGAELVDRLEATSGWDERFDLVEALVLRRMARAPHASEGIAWAYAQMEAAEGLVSIADLRGALDWTPRQLIDGFRREVGLAPKQMARILRFEHAVRLLEPDPAPCLAALAAECGYYDQAHFAREFREFAGCTPAQHRARLIPEGGVLDEEPGVGVDAISYKTAGAR